MARGIVPYLAGAWVLRFLWQAGRSRSWRIPAGALGSRVYLQDTLWVVFCLVLLSTVYTWTKVLIPAFGGEMWDATLADADRWATLGVNPNVVLLTIFRDGPAWAATALDRYYVTYIWITMGASAWFATDPVRANRLGFVTGFSAVWSLGLWGYMLMPAVGPALAFKGLWEEVAVVFPLNASLQTMLFENYQKVLAVLEDPSRNLLINPTYGLAAMPSLHVAAHAYLFFWARRIGSRFSGVFLGMTMLTFVGSVATGWHYILDSWVGLLLGWLVGRGAGWLRSGSSTARVD